MTKQEPEQERTLPTLSRRRMMQGTAAAGGAAVMSTTPVPYISSHNGRADAIGLITVGVGAGIGGAILGAGAKAAYDKYFSSDDSTTQEDIDEVRNSVNESFHADIFENANRISNSGEILHTDLADEISTDGAGGLESITWSIIRSEVFKALDNGKTESEAVDAAKSAFREKMSNIFAKWIDMWNVQVAKPTHHDRYMTLAKAQNTDGFSYTSVYEYSMATYSTDFFHRIYTGDLSGESGSGLSFTDSLFTIDESFPNGDTKEVVLVNDRADSSGNEPYIFEFVGPYRESRKTEYNITTNAEIDDGVVDSMELGTSASGPRVQDPYTSDTINPAGAAHGLITTYNDAWTYYENTISSISDYVSDIYSEYPSEIPDIDDFLTADDIVSQFASDNIGRATAELIAMGYSVDAEDLNTSVRISFANDGESVEQSGVLLIDIAQDTLAPFEYEYDGSILTIKDASLDNIESDDTANSWVVTYETTDADGNVVEETTSISKADLDDSNSYELGQDAVVSVERDFDGIKAITEIQEGQTVSSDAYDVARLVRKRADGSTVKERITGEFTLEEVTTEGRSSVSYTTYFEGKTGDIGREKEKLNQQTEAYIQTQEDLEEALKELENNGGGFFDQSGTPVAVILGVLGLGWLWKNRDDDSRR